MDVLRARKPAFPKPAAPRAIGSEKHDDLLDFVLPWLNLDLVCSSSDPGSVVELECESELALLPRDQSNRNELMKELYEHWLPVVGFEGLYEVSNRGRVRSLHRIVKHRHGGERRWKGRMMALTICRTTGYRQVGLNKDGERKTFTVHQLVAAAFLGPCPEGQQVLHGIAGKLNNSVENLRYGTRSEKEQDKKRDGTEPDRRGERSATAKLTEKQVLKIRELCSSGVAAKEIAEQFSIHHKYVSLIKTRTTWAHI